MRAIISQVTNPFANLALETVLFKHRKRAENLLFIYFNEPCVVIGRNQNPWAECNLQWPFPVVRRRSGGGAVVHDLGNANFCVQFDKEHFSRTRHLEMLVAAFPKLHLEINSRNDLIMPTAQGMKKVSGSSYKLERRGAYHHATLLLNSDLQRLSEGLRVPDTQGMVLNSGGTESVRSPVANTNLSTEEFIAGCVSQFRAIYGRVKTETATPDWFHTDEVKQEMAELQSWDWIFGKTPRFEIKMPDGEIMRVERGMVVGTDRPGLAGSSLVGQRMPLTGPLD